MANIRNSRLIFIDSEVNTVGNQSKAKINLPNHPFSVCCEDRMRLTLLSFDMRRSWYSVNQTNNVFYLRDPDADTYTEIVIAPGSYSTFASLAAAIQVGLQTALAAATCTYDDTTRKLTFTLTGIANNAYLMSFQVKQGTLPVGVSSVGFFQDTHELLGIIPSRTDAPVNGTGSVGAGTQSALFCAALNTLEAIYLRTNLMGGNYQTFGHERYLPDQNGLTETQIFARIPLNRACFDPIFEFVQYEDSNDLFQINLQQKHLDSFEMYVTDDKGRLLAEVDPRQADAGLMSFKCVLRWDHIAAAQATSYKPQVITNPRHVPTL
jgi:hypothetical protein